MRNAPLREYLKDYQTNPNNIILQSIKAGDSFPDKPFDINKLTYNEVRQINKKLRAVKKLEDYIDVIKIAYDCESHEVLELPIVNFFQIKKNIEEKMLSLLKKESEILSSASGDADMWLASGGDKLKHYGDVLPLDRLAKLYGGYPLDYGERKYVEIIYLLSMNATHDRVEKRFYELKHNHGRS